MFLLLPSLIRTPWANSTNGRGMAASCIAHNDLGVAKARRRQASGFLPDRAGRWCAQKKQTAFPPRKGRLPGVVGRNSPAGVSGLRFSERSSVRRSARSSWFRSSDPDGSGCGSDRGSDHGSGSGHSRYPRHSSWVQQRRSGRHCRWARHRSSSVRSRSCTCCGKRRGSAAGNRHGSDHGSGSDRSRCPRHSSWAQQRTWARHRSSSARRHNSSVQHNSHRAGGPADRPGRSRRPAADLQPPKTESGVSWEGSLKRR